MYHLKLAEQNRPPTIKESSQNLTVIRGYSRKLNCTVDGYPNPSLQWTCTNSTNNSPFEGSPVIILPNLVTNITCKCKASNLYGQDIRYFAIIVVGKKKAYIAAFPELMISIHFI